MSDFEHFPAPFGILSVEDELTTALVSQLTSQLTPLNVETIEEWHPQIEDRPRAYPQARLPAVWIYAGLIDTAYTIAQMMDLIYEVTIGVAVGNGDTQEARRLHEAIRENIAAVLSMAYMQGRTTFLTTSGYQTFFTDWSRGETKRGLDGQNPYLLWSSNSMRCRVVVPDTIIQ